MKKALTILAVALVAFLSACTCTHGLPAPGLPGNPKPAAGVRTSLSITISGLTCFYLEHDPGTGNYKDPVVVLVSAPGHSPQITFPAGINQSLCSASPCALAARVSVLDGSNPLTADFSLGSKSGEFEAYVTHLEDANFRFTDFHTDDMGNSSTPPKNSIVATLDLHGAEVTNVEHFSCAGNFDYTYCMTGAATSGFPRGFAKSVTITYTAANPTLHFINGTTTDVPIGTSAPIVISNDATTTPSPTMPSHFDMYSDLSKSKQCVPTVNKVPNSCVEFIPHDIGPGCGNTQWP